MKDKSLKSIGKEYKKQPYQKNRHYRYIKQKATQYFQIAHPNHLFLFDRQTDYCLNSNGYCFRMAY